jgi:carboxyl-terminal processing protease
MVKKIKKIFLIVSIAVASVVGYSFVDTYFEVGKNLDIFASMFREVNIYYVDTVNPGKLIKKGIDEMLNSLDPYTDFIPESDFQDYRFITTGQYGGIGAVIRIKGEYAIISEPYEGFPAQKNGLLAGDMILKIDDKPAKGKKTDEISQSLKGMPGTTVKLLIKRDGVNDPFEKTITRADIKVKCVPWSGFVGDGIGYIKLNNFTENASKELATALKELKATGTLNGLILDLRGNPGGLLNEAVNVSNIFIARGSDIVSTKGKISEFNKTYKTINEPVDVNVPLVVLVNSSSASASEIVSGSLQDLDRGVIVGQRTFGKGLVQSTRQLSYNTQLKITTSKYYIPSGRCIQAVDYSNRNEDGSVGKIPDSLIKTFKTKAGRVVYDGGGILPDVISEPEKLSNISVSLLSKLLIFDYATYYRSRNSQPDSGKIKLSDSDFSDFKSFISTKEYDYSTKSEKSLDDLMANAKEEKYYDELKKGIDELKTRLAHNKDEDVEKNKIEILSLLSEEISARYFYQAGRIRESLKNDVDVEKALEILGKPGYYSGILNGSINVDKVSTESPGK